MLFTNYSLLLAMQIGDLPTVSGEAEAQVGLHVAYRVSRDPSPDFPGVKLTEQQLGGIEALWIETEAGWYFREEHEVLEAGGRPGLPRREVLYREDVLHIGGNTGTILVLDREGAQAFGEESRLFHSRYFDAVGASMPDAVSRLGHGSEWPLSAEVAKLCSEDSSPKALNHEEGGRRTTQWFDCELGGAVLRWETRDAEGLIATGINARFSAVGERWFPTKTVIEWYRIPSVTGSASSPSPLLVETIEVEELSGRGVLPGSLGSLVPGTFVGDSRHKDRETAIDGYLTYVQPAGVDSLEAAVGEMQQGITKAGPPNIAMAAAIFFGVTWLVCTSAISRKKKQVS